MKKISTLCAVICIFFIQSCKKDPEPSREQLLSAPNGWKITDESYTSPSQGAVNIFSYLNDCEKDDILKFQSIGYYNVDEGKTKCSISDPQTVQAGNWIFDSSKTVVSIITSLGPSLGGLSSIYIVTLTKTKLVFKNSTGTSYYTYTYTAL